jgi:hypothetical protein
LLKFESKLVFAPYHHGKMIDAFHSPFNTVMTEQPRQLLHMDTIGLSRVRSMGGKWYVLIIVNAYSLYSLVFFLESKDEVFEHFWSLALRLNNEHPNCLKVIRSDNGTKSEMPLLISFALNMVLINSFLPRVCLNRMQLWNERTILHLRWLGRCSISIGLLDAFGPMLSALHVISQIGSSCAQSYI